MKRLGIRVLFAAIILFTCLYFGNQVSAQAVVFQNMKNHLAYKGYKCEIETQGKFTFLRCETETQYPNFRIRPQSGGFLLSSFFQGSQHAKRKRSAFLNFVNNLNVMAIATRYYVDKDGDLAMEVYIPGENYERNSFDSSVKGFNEDWDKMIKYFGDEVRVFLR